MEGFRLKIGLEIHAQLRVRGKLFSAEPSGDGAPNEHISPWSTGQPGVLPVFNPACLAPALRAAAALKFTVANSLEFDRKHYFYADLPKGYQISQNRNPLGISGELFFLDQEEKPQTLRLRSLLLEEDSGKSIHFPAENHSRLDFNRAGMALLEIVSEPDLTSGADAALAARALRDYLQALAVCNGQMEAGEFRVDVNLSVHSNDVHGPRVEIKNLNSFRHIRRAIQYEAARHASLIRQGEMPRAGTYTWLDDEGKTHFLREKPGYYWLPEPDFLPIRLSQHIHSENSVPSPTRQLWELSQTIGMEPAKRVGSAPAGLRTLFERIQSSIGPERAFSWMVFVQQHEVNGEDLAEKIEFLEAAQRDHRLSGEHEAQQSLLEWLKVPELSGSEWLKNHETRTRFSDAELHQLAAKILSANADLVRQYHAGKLGLFGFFMGEMMKTVQGAVAPGRIKSILQSELNKAQK